jgi:hypothetical protein
VNPTGGIADIQPGSSSDYILPNFSQTVTPSTVIYQMTMPASAHAFSLILSDFVAFGILPFTYPVTTQYTGSGPSQAELNYTITVGGSFGGSGAQSSEVVDIKATIGQIVSTNFDKTYSNSVNGGDYLVGYNFAPVVGSKQVGAGVDVTPSFSVADYKFGAFTSGFAAARNTWDTATIVETLTQLPDDPPAAPEPSYLLVTGPAVFGLAASKRLRKRLVSGTVPL